MTETKATPENAWSLLADEDKSAERLKALANSLGSMHLYFNKLVSGDESNHYLAYFKDTFLPNKPIKIASFGSGGGQLEQNLIHEFGYDYDVIDGYEINPALVRSCNESALANGLPNLKYHVSNLNSPNLPNNKYDLGIFFHSLHHVESLDVCLNSVKQSLAENGILLVVEFVGPNRFQWSKEQLAFAKALLDFLPDRYKKMGGGIKSSINRPTVEEVIAGDPSEAPRSQDILGALDRHFRKVELKSHGGTILQLLLENIAQNFDESDPTIVKMLQDFQNLEQYLIINGFISSDYIFGVYKKC